MKTKTAKQTFSLFVIILLLSSTITFLVIPTVGATTGNSVNTSNSNPSFYPWARSVFYAANLYWVWWWNSSYLNFATSSDGSTWSAQTAVTANGGSDFSITFNGTQVFYVAQNSYQLYYRVGTPGSNGAITWIAAEQSISTGGNSASQVSIAVDTNGYSWVGCEEYIGGDEPFILESNHTDGTWSSVQAYNLNSTTAGNWAVQPIALTAGKVYVAYGCYKTPTKDQILQGRLWTGSWSAVEKIGSYPADLAISWLGPFFSLANQGDNVLLAYLANNTNTYQIRYDNRTYGVGWAADELVATSVNGDASPSLVYDISLSETVCFWGNTTGVYYETQGASSTTWSSLTTLISDTIQDVYGSPVSSAISYSANGYDVIPIIYQYGTSTPFTIKFSQIKADLTAPTYSSPATNTTLDNRNCNFTVSIADNVALSNYTFGCNTTGSWANDSLVNIPVGSTSYLANATHLLPLTVGAIVQWEVWFADTSNNLNNTGIQSLITSDGDSPKYTSITSNTTYANQTVLLSCQWSDNVAVSGFIFGTNNTGSWVNQTWSSSLTNGWANETFKLNNTIGNLILSEWWCNDTSNNWNNTGSQVLTTIGFTVVITTDGHAITSPVGPVSVDYGDLFFLTVSANSGYTIQAVSDNNVNQGSVNSYTITHVTGNHTILISTNPIPNPFNVPGNFVNIVTPSSNVPSSNPDTTTTGDNLNGLNWQNPIFWVNQIQVNPWFDLSLVIIVCLSLGLVVKFSSRRH